MPTPEMWAVLHYSQPQQVCTTEGVILVPVPHVYGPFAAAETASNWARGQHWIAFEVVELETP